MLIKNVTEADLDITVASRTIHMTPGEEVLVTPVEVRDPVLRTNLEVRTIAIVRPATDDEDAASVAAEG